MSGPGAGAPAGLIARLIETPGLARTIRALPAPAFSALIRHVGLEDAGELVALATTDQLEAVFDEDLFVNERPGARESFDSARFVVWLEVLLEAGDRVAAARVAELSEDFVVHALQSLVLVLDREALLHRMRVAPGDDALGVDKALESCLAEELDDYLLISRQHDGWDAALALILALDRDHRALLVRVLDRCACVASDVLDDLDALAGVLSGRDALAEDVEGEREARRSRRGYVEPRAARSFLAMARQPPDATESEGHRDPLTRAYFRELERPEESVPSPAARGGVPADLRVALEDLAGVSAGALLAPPAGGGEPLPPLVAAMRQLRGRDPRAFDERVQELAYLVNVLVAGAEAPGGRFRPATAADAVLATVAFGGELEARRRGSAGPGVRATADTLCDVLRATPADRLFRVASGTLATEAPSGAALLRSQPDLEDALGRLDALPPGSRRE